MFYKQFLLFTICSYSWLGWSNYCFAAQSEITFDPFIQMIPMEGRGYEERIKAIQQGIEKVLIMLTGDVNITSKDQIALRIKQPEQALLRYQYVQPKHITETLQLQLTFDRKRIEEWLKEANLPLWKLKRPVIMTWVSIEDASKDMEIYQESLQKLIITQAQKVGVPLRFPIMDMAEIVELTKNDIKDTNKPLLTRLSERYQTNKTLTASLKYDTNRESWQCDWVLLNGNEEEKWHEEHADLTILIQQSIHSLIQKLQVLDKEVTDQFINVIVSSLDSKAASNRVEDYFRSISNIEKIDMEVLNDSEIRYQLVYKGNLLKLKSNIEKAPFLRMLHLKEIATNNLHYEYIS